MTPHAIVKLILLKITEYSKVCLALLSSHQLELIVCCWLVYESGFSKEDVWGESLAASEGMRFTTTQISVGSDFLSLLGSLLSREVCLLLTWH